MEAYILQASSYYKASADEEVNRKHSEKPELSAGRP
jgi:hypothetical protein